MGLIVLLVVIALEVLPHARLAAAWPLIDAPFRLFCATLGERGGHAVAFLLMGTTLLLAFPSLRRDPLSYLLILVAVGVTQECVQLLFKARASGVNELHDLAVDLSAGATVWVGAAALRLRPVRRCLLVLGRRG